MTTAEAPWASVDRRLGLALTLNLFALEDEENGRAIYVLHIHLIWPAIWLRIPLLRGTSTTGHEEWGFVVDPDTWRSLILSWGVRSKWLHLPKWLRRPRLFRHTHREPRLWRGWLKNGQSVEISWSHAWDFGAGIHIHSNDMDMGDRMIFLRFWRLIVVLPLGIVRQEYQVGDEPQWSAYASSEFGLTFHWGKRRKQFEWPFHTVLLEWDYETVDGWRSNMGRLFDDWNEAEPVPSRPGAKIAEYPYQYRLRCGEVQNVTATIIRERSVKGRNILHRLGWPKRTEYAIDVHFSGEVGERAGSWKGGCVGCGYNMLPGEEPLDTLRRMERERTF